MEQKTGSSRNNGNVGNVARDLQATAQEQIDELRDRVEDLSERVTGFIKERPGTSIAIAVGAGFLIGRLLRS
jgi:ElaB/YqjD/DUF883 family membrane-anchored ribosome-binding protein